VYCYEVAPGQWLCEGFDEGTRGEYTFESPFDFRGAPRWSCSQKTSHGCGERWSRPDNSTTVPGARDIQEPGGR
jgi:hypothetical protein